MKKIILSSVIAMASLFSANNSFAQATVAMDFNRADCNGNMHHLFTNDLDSGNVVILEFFMGGGCASCITAGHSLEAMKVGLLAAHPGKIRSYASGFQNSMDCSVVSAWVTSNGFTSTPIDSGAAQVAYYGGFGMPTIVILAGNTHKVIYTGIGFSAGDTVGMKDSISKFFNPGTAAIKESTASVTSVNVSPNPAANAVVLEASILTAGNLTIQLTDITGKLLSTVVNENVVPGAFSKKISTAELPDGLYMVRTVLNGYTSVAKLTVAK